MENNSIYILLKDKRIFYCLNNNVCPDRALKQPNIHVPVKTGLNINKGEEKSLKGIKDPIQKPVWNPKQGSHKIMDNPIQLNRHLQTQNTHKSHNLKMN